MDRQYPQPVIQVGPKSIGRDGLSKIRIRGRDDSNINRNICPRADSPHSSLLKQRSNFTWAARLRASTSSRKTVPPDCLFKEAATVLVGSSEGTSLMAKQFSLDQGFRNSRAVDIDKWSITARALVRVWLELPALCQCPSRPSTVGAIGASNTIMTANNFFMIAIRHQRRH